MTHKPNGSQNADVSSAKRSGSFRAVGSASPRAGVAGMVVRYLRGIVWRKRPKASRERINSWMLVTVLSFARSEVRVLGIGEVV